MITTYAHGFIAEKPAVEMVSARSCKCEFTVIWARPSKRGGAWETVWERAMFVAWDEEAERVASRLDKGVRVTCTGTQETSSWQDRSGQKRYITKYRLTSWFVEIQRQPNGVEGRQPSGSEPQQERAAAGASRCSNDADHDRRCQSALDRTQSDDGYENHHGAPDSDHQIGQGAADGDDFIVM